MTKRAKQFALLGVLAILFLLLVLRAKPAGPPPEPVATRTARPVDADAVSGRSSRWLRAMRAGLTASDHYCQQDD